MNEEKKYELTKDEQVAVRDYLTQKGLPYDFGVTFDDVHVPEHFSTIRSRREISDFSTYLTDSFKMHIPFVSANMETVTGVQVMVDMKRAGGLGFYPQSLPIEDRLEMLERERRTDCAFIDEPLQIDPAATLRDAKKLMTRFNVNSLILVKNKKPVGVLTHRDWAYVSNDKIRVSDIAGAMGKKLITAPRSINFERAGEILKKHKIEKLPLIDHTGKLAGLITAHGLFYSLSHPWAMRDARGQFVLCGTIGVGRYFTKDHLREVESQVKKGVRIQLIDTARAQSVNAEEAIRKIRKHFPELIIIAGNVSTAKGAKALFEWGADVVKVNQGRGHVCRTSRIGIGNPQITAIAETKAIAMRYGKRIMADGGMKSVGDCFKAIIAGADVLMTGFLVVGTHESAAELKFNKDGFPVKTYVGSASLEAQRARIKHGTLDQVREPEGVAEDVPVTGSLNERMHSYLDGLRSAMSYCGVRNIAEAQKLSFRLQSQAGLREGTKK